MVKKLKARTGGEKGRHLRPPLVQKLESRSVKKKSKTKRVGVGVGCASTSCCSC